MTVTRARVVLVDDDESFRKIMSRELERSGFELRSFPSAEGVCESVAADAPDALLLDLRMPGMPGDELLEELLAQNPDLQVIVLTGHGAVPEAVAAMRAGAFDFLSKPVALDVLEQTLLRAVELSRLIAENKRLRQASTTSAGVLSLPSKESQQLEQQIDKIAVSEQSVLILGESGTGKEIAARKLHAASPRRDAPFVPVNCAAIPADLIESELFGHAKGAFTGAGKARNGLFESADGGTLFLDEIGELPLSLQPSLLRALQLGEVRPVGSDESHRVDVRIIAATNQDLRERIAASKFREDLYYRLAVFEMKIPALRERPEDALALAQFFLHREAARSGRPLCLTPTAEQWVVEQAWPGNIRELENAILRVAVLASSPEIDVNQLLETRALPSDRAVGAKTRELPTLRIRDLEMLAIEAALQKCHGNKTRAAEELGIALKTLYNKLARSEEPHVD
jgi:DNA-binding NtrC family response regulator